VNTIGKTVDKIHKVTVIVALQRTIMINRTTIMTIADHKNKTKMPFKVNNNNTTIKTTTINNNINDATPVRLERFRASE
jgi:hypothetical protein